MTKIHRIYHTIKVEKKNISPFFNNSTRALSNTIKLPPFLVKRMTSQLAVKTSKPGSCGGCTKAANSRPCMDGCERWYIQFLAGMWLGVGDKDLERCLKPRTKQKKTEFANSLSRGFSRTMCVMCVFWMGCQHMDFQKEKLVSKEFWQRFLEAYEYHTTHVPPLDQQKRLLIGPKQSR